MNFAKDPWRQDNVAFMKRLTPLWKKGKLQYRYLEMLGESGDRMYDILKPHLNDPKSFEGVDQNFVYLMEHALKGAEFELVSGDFYAVALGKLKEKSSENGMKIGVVNFDTTNNASAAWWSHYGQDLRDIVRLGSSGCERFAIILNHVLDIRGESHSTLPTRIRLHAKALVETFTGWEINQPSLTQGVERVADPEFKTSRVGGFDIYKCGDRPTRMITIRLSFDKSRKRIIIDKGA